jgi:hypothetical protein
MKNFRTFFPALLGLGLLSSLALVGCTELDGLDDGAIPDEESLSTTSSELSLASWQPASRIEGAYYGGQMATVGGTTYLVHSATVYSGDELFWQKQTATGWSSNVLIRDQRSTRRVSVAAFNGMLYMVHAGLADDTAVWISHLDPSTDTWSPPHLLPYTTFAGPPALVVYNNKLHLIGTTPGTYQMWMATMSAGEIFSPSRPILGHESASQPAAAVFNNTLFVAHRYGQTGELVYSTFNGATWTADQYINVGPLGAPIRGIDPALASVNGYLHLVHRQPGTDNVWWTYFNGCEWPAEITVGTTKSTYFPSLVQGARGLQMITLKDGFYAGYRARYMDLTEFVAPPAPIVPPRGCGVIGGV